MGVDNTEQMAAEAAKKMVETLREKESKLEEKWNGLNNRSQEWQKKLEFVHPVSNSILGGVGNWSVLNF